MPPTQVVATIEPLNVLDVTMALPLLWPMSPRVVPAGRKVDGHVGVDMTELHGAVRASDSMVVSSANPTTPAEQLDPASFADNVILGADMFRFRVVAQWVVLNS